MDKELFRVKIPYTVTINREKIINLKRMIKEYLNTRTVKELSLGNCIMLENDIYIDSKNNINIMEINTSHCIGMGRFGEITDDYVEFICTKLFDDSYKVDLDSIRFANPVINHASEEFNTIAMIHIYATLRKDEQ